MMNPLRPLRATLACAAALAAPVHGIGIYTNSDLLPLQNDFTVATCYSSTALANLAFLPLPDPNGNVVVVWNTSPTLPNGLTGKPMGEPASAGANWHYYHNELAQQSPVAGAQHEWKAKHLGEVFGTALDDGNPPNIYVAASKAYGYATWPAGNGPGTVYKLDAISGAITAFPQLPGAAGGTPGPASGNSADAALGNLCFHRTPTGPAWLYVTNMGDGRIYRMDPVTGANTASFDHGTQALPVASYPSVSDNTALVYTQTVRRPWGIGVHAGRLYYSIFDSMDPWPPALHPNAVGPQPEIWSVALNTAGNFLPATALREFKIPPLSLSYSGFGPLGRSSMPISDIEFTLSGAMVLAERYHTGCTSPFSNGSGSWNQMPNYLLGAHSTRVLEYTGSSGSWVASPQNKFRVGSNPWGNSAGGVGPACDGSVWCTGDALGVFQSLAAYGQQRIRGQGNATDVTPLVQSYIIDYDCAGIYYGKSLIGDVDTVTEPLRVRTTMVSAVCPPVPGAPYLVTLNITNLMQVPLTQVGFGPCPPQFLPPGGQSLVPSPPLVNITIPPGGNANINVTMTALPNGGIKCFSIQGNPADFGGGGAGHDAAFLCSPKVCVNLPKCPCMDAKLTNPVCPVYEGQEHSATLTITNLWNITADFWQMLPCPQNELPPGAITLQPSPQGLQAFAPPLAPNSTSPPINITFPGLPVQNTPTTVCFIVRLLPLLWEQEGPFCEAKVCVTFPPCPPLLPCVSGAIADVKCPTAPPGNYTMNLTITNLGPVPAASATLTPCAPVTGGIPANPLPPFIPLGPLNQNQSTTVPIQLGGVGTGGALACFCLTLYDANGRPICSTIICQQLPPCPCATFSIGGITCPQYEGQPYNAVVTVTNTGFTPIFWIGFLPCPQAQLPAGALPGIGVGPAGILPLQPPLPPGLSMPVPITLTGIPKAGGLVCFTVRVFGQMEGHPLCEEKLCFNVPPCPPCLPCMNALATAAQCPVVQGGPFTTNLTITNLQPVTAVTAQLVPCLPGLQAGEVAATPTPGTIALPPLLQNQSQTYTISLSGVSSGQIACFCVRLLDAAGKVLCERPVCLTLPFCPPLCSTVSPVEIVCPQGGNGYSAFLNIFNQSASTFFNYQTCPVPVGSLPAGAMTGQPSPAGIAPLSPAIAPNTTGGAPVQLPNNLPSTGGTFCFIIKFFGQFDNLICQQMVCLQLPACVCGLVLNHSVDCVPGPAGLKRQLTITVQNLTNVFGPAFNFDVATIAPGGGFSPAVITPNPNPIPPGGTGTLTTCFLGGKPPACIHILLTNSARTLCCPLKLCPLWVECAQEQLHPDRCDLAPQFTSENGGNAPATAWIYNGSGSPKSYTFTITPVSVPGCTGTLPPVAFFPASGLTLPVGAYGSLGINFTISGASLLAGQCAGFQICFQETGPAVPPPPVCCISKLKRSNNDVCVDWNPTGRSIPVGAGLRTIVIKNPTSAAMPVSLLLVQSGGVEFSLTGEYAPADSSGAGGPAVDYDSMPIELVLGPHESVPLSFTAKVKAIPFPGPGPGPVWAEWQLLKRCNVLPYDPVDVGVDDPHTLAAAVFHVPFLQPPSPAPPLSLRDFSFLPGVAGPAAWTEFQSSPGEILHPQSTDDLSTWMPEEIIPYAAVQAADGSVAGTGETLWSFRVQSSDGSGTAPRPRSFHRFFGD